MAEGELYTTVSTDSVRSKLKSGYTVHDIVLVGAGHAHVAVLRAFGMRPIPGLRLTLLTRDVDPPYSGMLPGIVAGRYAADDARFDAGRLYRDEAACLAALHAGGDRQAALIGRVGPCSAAKPVRLPP